MKALGRKLDATRRQRLAIIGAVLVLLLAALPIRSEAWWADQPRFEKQIVTEGDPEDPGIATPGEPSSPVSDEVEDIGQLVEIVLTVLTESLGL